MKKLGAILLAVLSIPFLTLGLIFLIAASSLSRAAVAIVLLGAGLALLIYAIRRLRRLASISPEALRTGAVDLARRMGGELTVAQLRAEYRLSSEQAAEVLEELTAEGTCERDHRPDRIVYVFRGLQESVTRRVCPYCGTELPVREALNKCPNCGAQLELEKS